MLFTANSSPILQLSGAERSTVWTVRQKIHRQIGREVLAQLVLTLHVQVRHTQVLSCNQVPSSYLHAFDVNRPTSAVISIEKVKTLAIFTMVLFLKAQRNKTTELTKDRQLVQTLFSMLRRVMPCTQEPSSKCLPCNSFPVFVAN